MNHIIAAAKLCETRRLRVKSPSPIVFDLRGSELCSPIEF